ncbi:restriction endonuclease [Pseudomonas sp. 31-12]|uniref:restriction endonuclease n=1 Tax=Pseudomonas sp. 31-12 TaxID=2201356 RepID=UPI000D6BE731|nr:restriction endonuclease [Pseudomonas sp. 31-12]AWM91709.1 restriction endonuclease [Pseudomonas sp. 31-12]
MSQKRKNSDWYKFQEKIKEHFESLGAIARTNVRTQGARASHDIDILVSPKFFGKEITWIVEAKNWSNNVSKEKVMALLSIVQDIGADRGFIISNKGFQKAALECVRNTNITLANFEEFKESTKDFVNTEVIKHYELRLKLLHARYWAHPKRIRRDYNLRHDICSLSPFSGTTLLGFIEHVIQGIKRKNYPISTDTGLEINIGEKQIHDFHQACNWLNLNLNLLDQQLLKAEMMMMKNGEFRPEYERWASAF